MFEDSVTLDERIKRNTKIATSKRHELNRARTKMSSQLSSLFKPRQLGDNSNSDTNSEKSQIKTKVFEKPSRAQTLKVNFEGQEEVDLNVIDEEKSFEND